MVQWPWPPGTIVVCIDNKDTPEVIVGEYYTIKRAWYANSDEAENPGPAVLLNEVTIDPVYIAYDAFDFRPAESNHIETITKEIVCSEPSPA